MKKFVFSLTVLLTVFVFSTKAQHQDHADKEVTVYPPKLLFTKQLPASLRKEEAKVVLVRFAPGEVSHAHRHPMATIGYVLEGSIESTFEGVKHVYKEGEVFWEEPGGLHNQTRNLSNTKEAKLVVFFVGSAGSPVLIPEQAKN
ncbi:Cupin domain-containing protein [Chitinophaga sp. CF118]|uniref:cupin domain-containing protein n=1 Tax=Chitinophaga sp. CF118 TaxID=1884367 RepID=UPI0008EC1734|nr:cupin domain-containing protein [Chitinophaga sp. CF118]SFD16407.1 Cupin domain-containing protein [Chitinophaga sp. CF118]